MALSHRSGAGSSPRGRSAFGERGFTGQPAGTKKGLCTKCGFIAFTMGMGTRQHQLGVRLGASEHPTSGSALCGTAMNWVIWQQLSPRHGAFG